MMPGGLPGGLGNIMGGLGDLIPNGIPTQQKQNNPQHTFTEKQWKKRKKRLKMVKSSRRGNRPK